jgi:SAM-dependent methyltransferase
MGVSGYWNNLALHDGGACIDDIWLNHPLVRAEVNRRVSGDPAMWATHWLRAQIQEPLRRTLSIGCGTGAFERDVVSQNIVEHITGIDLEPQPLERARQLAVEANLASRISYEQGDALELLRKNPGSFDAIFFHASLHHFADPHAILTAVHAGLRPRGYLYIDEYAGPSRDEWPWFRMILPNLAYYLLPRRVRRPRIVRAPINREDPTEAIASSRIVPVLHSTFDSAVTRTYGGNLLAVIYPNLYRPPSNGVTDILFDKAIARLIRFERTMLRLGANSYYVVALARR